MPYTSLTSIGPSTASQPPQPAAAGHLDNESTNLAARSQQLKMSNSSNLGIMTWATSIRLNMANDPGRQYVEDQIQEHGFKFLDDYLATVLEGPKEECVYMNVLPICTHFVSAIPQRCYRASQDART